MLNTPSRQEVFSIFTSQLSKKHSKVRPDPKKEFIAKWVNLGHFGNVESHFLLLEFVSGIWYVTHGINSGFTNPLPVRHAIRDVYMPESFTFMTVIWNKARKIASLHVAVQIFIQVLFDNDFFII